MVKVVNEDGSWEDKYEKLMDTARYMGATTELAELASWIVPDEDEEQSDWD
jgi:hypothetical protein